MTEKMQYILLPRKGLRAESGLAANLLVAMPRPASPKAPEIASLAMAGVNEPTVIESLHENGPKLVELDRASAMALNAPDGPLRAVPVVEYGRPDPKPRPFGPSPLAVAAAPVQVTVTVTDTTGKAVRKMHVIAFTNFASREGAEGVTDGSGRVVFTLYGAIIERLYCYPPPGYWGAFQWNVPVNAAISIQVSAVALDYIDCVRYYYANSRFDASTGVTVGVIDTGVGPHSLLNIVGGANAVTGENPADYGDGDQHGTHVAGLIGAHGTPPGGLRGMAPGVPIRSYRVFGSNSHGASNYAILKAMILAASDRCDIINLSLGGGPYDPIVEEAIVDARNQGMLVVLAAGNDGRMPVSYPAAYPGATAVSAMGREGTFPPGSLDEADVLRPPYSSVDGDEFLASFSNVGQEIAVTGIGVGALSTLPCDQYGPMSGTSMAAPVVTGAVACLLSRTPTVFNKSRDRARSDAIEKLLQTNCAPRGFGSLCEGYGLPNPAMV